MDSRQKVQLIGLLALCILSLLAGMSLPASAQSHGYISIAFDDGTQTQYDYAYPLLHARGMNATYYAIASKVGISSYMNSSELKNLQNTGSEIGSHSNTHPDFTTLNDSKVQQECQVSKQTLQSFGLTINNFAYPYGSRNNHTDQIVAQYYRSARSGYLPPYLMQIPETTFLIPGFGGETGDSTALSKLTNQVDQVYATGCWEIIFFHNVMPNTGGNQYAISTADFASFLDYVAKKGITTLTVNQGLDLAPPQPPFSVSISPSSVKLNIGQTFTFSSVVSGGKAPYSYQWYLNNTPVPNSNEISFTFTPTQAGNYNLILILVDGQGNGTKSNIVSDIQVTNLCTLSISTNLGDLSPNSSDYRVGSVLNISAMSPAILTGAIGGERYIWRGWVGSGNGSYNGLSNSATITMNGPIVEVAQWEHQYLVTFSSSGLGAEGTGVVITVNGLVQAFSDLPSSFWVVSGQPVIFDYAQVVSGGDLSKQYNLVSVNASSSQCIFGPTNVIGVYTTQDGSSKTSSNTGFIWSRVSPNTISTILAPTQPVNIQPTAVPSKSPPAPSTSPTALPSDLLSQPKGAMPIIFLMVGIVGSVLITSFGRAIKQHNRQLCK